MHFSLFRRPKPKAYWWAPVPNFGDALAPLLLSRFADLEVDYAPIADASIASIGSILEHIPADWRGCILGSGQLCETSQMKFTPCDTRILALRGPLSARGIHGDFALGDPGLLANELIEPQEKKWDLGIVPHWRDDKLAQRFLKLIPGQFTCRVISPQQSPITVITEIAQCRRVVTSSLHGMIVADAIGGIPRRVEVCEAEAAKFGMFKFFDYSASINCRFEVGKMIEPERNRVDDCRFALYDAYRELGGIYGKA